MFLDNNYTHEYNESTSRCLYSSCPVGCICRGTFWSLRRSATQEQRSVAHRNSDRVHGLTTASRRQPAPPNTRERLERKYPSPSISASIAAIQSYCCSKYVALLQNRKRKTFFVVVNFSFVFHCRRKLGYSPALPPPPSPEEESKHATLGKMVTHVSLKRHLRGGARPL